VGAGRGESVAAGLADGLAAAVVLVFGGDVADGLVEPHGVVVLPSDVEFVAQDRGVDDAVEVGVPGRPKCWAIRAMAMNSAVLDERIWGPLSETASSIGTRSSLSGR
jgi:hypothetical protein